MVSGDTVPENVPDIETYFEQIRRLGMVLVVDQSDNELTLAQPFEKILSPDQYILKEGFDDFAQTRDLKIQSVSKTFSRLIDSRDRRVLLGSYTPQPSPGIDIKSRRELGIPRYGHGYTDTYGAMRYIARYAIRAGSIVTATETLGRIAELKPEALNTSESILVRMATALNMQFS